MSFLRWQSLRTININHKRGRKLFKSIFKLRHKNLLQSFVVARHAWKTWYAFDWGKMKTTSKKVIFVALRYYIKVLLLFFCRRFCVSTANFSNGIYHRYIKTHVSQKKQKKILPLGLAKAICMLIDKNGECRVPLLHVL